MPFCKPSKGLKLWFPKTALILMSHRTKEPLGLDPVTWSVSSTDMNLVISSALTLTPYTIELPGRLGLRLKHPLCVGKFRHRFLKTGLCFTYGQFSSGWFASSPICCCGFTHAARGLFLPPTPWPAKVPSLLQIPQP